MLLADLEKHLFLQQGWGPNKDSQTLIARPHSLGMEGNANPNSRTLLPGLPTVSRLCAYKVESGLASPATPSAFGISSYKHVHKQNDFIDQSQQKKKLDVQNVIPVSKSQHELMLFLGPGDTQGLPLPGRRRSSSCGTHKS